MSVYIDALLSSAHYLWNPYISSTQKHARINAAKEREVMSKECEIMQKALVDNFLEVLTDVATALHLDATSTISLQKESIVIIEQRFQEQIVFSWNQGLVDLKRKWDKAGLDPHELTKISWEHATMGTVRIGMRT